MEERKLKEMTYEEVIAALEDGMAFLPVEEREAAAKNLILGLL